ncbi:MAG: hypothetical protein NTZ38_02080 [Candidatus Taylorbacteria bacterium]|nr:hypothetical protein [Candidatus Taylorbacteria bacterium]
MESNKKVGPIVAILVIVVIVVIVVVYLLVSRVNKQSMPNDLDIAAASINHQSTTASPLVKPITNTADDIQSLQNDLNKATEGVGSQRF